MSAPLERLSAALADRYRVERELGAGGMATVYLAEDLKHARKVALKVLKPELAAVVGAERFLAEIKTTANLQHPHILALFDSGQVDGTVFYVMPFVNGESLRDRLDREKQLPIEDGLLIAREVGDALQYAHSHGVIHRDIKPENILLQGGHALVADFGIALAASKTGGSRMTETGMSLGTPMYMSPEQAMGERTLDARTDIYALGCVLYEMLTGDAPFTGSTAQAIVAKVLTEKPASIVAQRDRVPEHVEDAVLTALEKLPADRFASAGEFVAAISGAEGSGRTTVQMRARARATSTRSAGAWRIATGALAIVSLALAAALVVKSGAGEAPHMVRLEVQTGEPIGSLPVVIAGAPDGSSYLYCSSTGAVLLRRWENLAPTSLAGPISGCVAAAYSPDAKSIAIVGVPTSLHLFSVGGETPRREIRVEGLGDMATDGGALDWASDDHLYIASGSQILRVASDDGTWAAINRSDSLSVFYGLDVLPGARHALVVTAPTFGANMGDTRVGVLDLATGVIDPLNLSGVVAKYVHPGNLLVVRFDGSMVVIPFDLGRRAASGTASSLPDSVGIPPFAGYFQGVVNVAPDGTLFFMRSRFAGTSSAVFVDRRGVEEPLDEAWEAGFLIPRLSPDGTRLAAEVVESGRSVPAVRDLRTGATRTLLAGRGTINGRVSWLPNGLGLSVISNQDGTPRQYQWQLNSDVASAAPRYDERGIYAAEWARVGSWLLLRTDDQAAGLGDIVAVRPGIDSVAIPIVASPTASEYSPALSPDARWLAYVSNEDGSYEVRVTDFPSGRARWKVTTAGGSEPAWSGDGRELFYVAGGEMMVATLAPGAEFKIVSQRRLFSLAPYVMYGIWNRNYDVTRDGQRFLMLKRSDDATSSIAVIQNWGPGLRALTGGR